MNIYISMERKQRELDGRLLLALVAAERGHSVVLGSKAETMKPAVQGRFAPGIVHLKSLTSYDPGKKKMDGLLRNGHVVTSQDEEHGLLYESHESFATFRYDPATVARTARIFAWGTHDGDTLRNMFGSDEATRRKIVDTGSPRVDFWRRDFEPYYSAAMPRNIRNRKGYLLIVSNMMRAFNRHPFWESVRAWRDSGYFRDEDAELEWYEYTCWQVRVVADFVRMVRVLSRAFPDTPIVIRPHPVEHKDAWPSVVGDCPNVEVIRSGLLSPWIRSAKAVIQNGCTSGFEAAVAGVPVFTYTTQDTEFDRAVANQVTRQVRTLDSLVENMRRILAGEGDHTTGGMEGKRNAILQARFGNLEGRLAADRIVDEWEDLRTPELEKPHVIRPLSLYDRWRNVRKRLRRSRFLQSQKKRSRAAAAQHDFGELTDGELSAIHNGLRASLNRFANVEMNRIGPASFQFFRRKGSGAGQHPSQAS